MRRPHRMGSLPLLLALGTLGAALSACDPGRCEDEPAGDPAQCGFACDEADTIDAGNLAFGVASTDAALVALAELARATDTAERELEAELRSLGRRLALPASLVDEADLPALVPALLGAHQEQVEGHVDGTFRIRMDAPACGIAPERAARLFASCDPVEDWLRPTCDGRCVIAPEDTEACADAGQLSCRAAGLTCEGSCDGDCAMPFGDLCPATCVGTCEGDCDVQGPDGSCLGRCSGECIGVCELAPGQSCPVRCESTCRFETDEDACPDSGTAECRDADAAGVPCEGPCIGRLVAPPDEAVECRIAVRVGGAAAARCEPPRAVPVYRLQDDLSAADALRLRGLARVEAEHLARLAALAHPEHGRAARLRTEVVALLEADFEALVLRLDAIEDRGLNLLTQFHLDCLRLQLDDQLERIRALEPRLDVTIQRYVAIEQGLGGIVP